MIAYPLSKEPGKLPGRTAYAWYFFFTMLFGGGLIPTFLVVKYSGLMDSIWSLIIPGAVPIFNVILLLNFFRQLPRELEEAAFIDGAGHWKTMWNIYLPISLPGLATICLFSLVGHWNEWFSAIIYMKHTENYPLQTYLQMVLVQTNFRVSNQSDLDILNKLSNKTVNSAQIFIGMIPILCVYPFLQKYFTKGIVLGSVKG
jgi:putative aldouronate transport system permease protein